MKKQVKVSFVGDIMCEKPLLKASTLKDGSYNFDTVFQDVTDKIKESDYTVGNLETVCAGSAMKYTDYIYSFNTPDEFIASVRRAGINMVTTANNHCLDRELNGLLRTMDILEKYHLDYIGTSRTKEESEEIFIRNIAGIKFAFLSYTYGTNYKTNKYRLPDEKLFHVNLLSPPCKGINEALPSTETLQKKVIKKILPTPRRMRIKKVLRMPYNYAYTDHLKKEDQDDFYLNSLERKVKKARDNADIVIFCMHSGGQFNNTPGSYTKFFTDMLANLGVDFIIGSHPHVVQGHKFYENHSFAFYSLGNFTISPGSVYILHDDLPEFSIMLHLYFAPADSRIEKITFTILKIVEHKDHQIRVIPVNKLDANLQLKKDCAKIYSTFTNTRKSQIEINDEYILYESGERYGK